MKNATEYLQQYRMCCRDLWNQYVRSERVISPIRAIEIYDKLKPGLFDLIVVTGLGFPSGTRLSLKVVPNVSSQNGTTSAKFTLLEQREDGGLNATTTLRLFSHEVVVIFIDFFDWGNQSYSDLRWMKVRLETVTDQPNLNGQLALLDAYDADIVVDE